MDPVTATMALSAGQAALALPAQIQKMVLAARQNKLAKKFEQQQRPTYETPTEIIEATDMARNAYLDPNLRGQRLMEEKLGAQTAGLVREMKEGAGGANALMAGLAGAGRGMGTAMNQLNLAANQQNQMDQRMLDQALARQAGYTDKEWELNKFQPYQDAAAAASALRQASATNLYDSLKGIGGVAASTGMFAPGGEGMKKVLGLFGPKGEAASTGLMSGAQGAIQQQGIPAVPVNDMSKAMGLASITPSLVADRMPPGREIPGDMGKAKAGEPYSVKAGDTLWKIASSIGVNYEQLKAANPQITNPDKIYPGQVLNIPNYQ